MGYYFCASHLPRGVQFILLLSFGLYGFEACMLDLTYLGLPEGASPSLLVSVSLSTILELCIVLLIVVLFLRRG